MVRKATPTREPPTDLEISGVLGVKALVSPMALVCDGLERGVRATIPIFVISERLLILFGCLLLLAIFAPLGGIDAKSLLALAGVTLNAIGVVAYRMHVSAIKRADLWKGIADAYRDPNIPEAKINLLDAVVLERLKSETQNVGRGISGILKGRAPAEAQ